MKETIVVKEMKEVPTAKGNMLCLKINGNRDVSVAAWHKQEIDFVKKDVGLGGNFKGDVVENGKYLNVENIDFDSANKATGDEVATEKVEDAPKDATPLKLLSQKEISIIAQVMTKCVYYGKSDASLGQVLDTYHEACLALETHG